MRLLSRVVCRVVPGQRKAHLDAAQQSDMITQAKQEPARKLQECNSQVGGSMVTRGSRYFYTQEAVAQLCTYA